MELFLSCLDLSRYICHCSFLWEKAEKAVSLHQPSRSIFYSCYLDFSPSAWNWSVIWAQPLADLLTVILTAVLALILNKNRKALEVASNTTMRKENL